MEAVPPMPMALTVLEIGAICGKSLGVGTSDMYNVGESGVWEELIDEVWMSGKEVMDVKRRDCMRLRFNELVHVVSTGKG